jgi:hypothetical protein
VLIDEISGRPVLISGTRFYSGPARRSVEPKRPNEKRRDIMKQRDRRERCQTINRPRRVP